MKGGPSRRGVAPPAVLAAAGTVAQPQEASMSAIDLSPSPRTLPWAPPATILATAAALAFGAPGLRGRLGPVGAV